MAEKQQFDEFLGGSQSLPHEVSIMKLVASRASEISAMTHSIGMIYQISWDFCFSHCYIKEHSINVVCISRMI